MIAMTGRIATALIVAGYLFVASCGSSGDGAETITVKLSSNEACYGIEIDVDESGLSAADSGTPTSCAAGPFLDDLDCDVQTRISNNRYQISVRDCLVPDDTAVVVCTVPGALAERFRTAMDLRCGCGCQQDCPDEPTALVCEGDGLNCQATTSDSAGAPEAESQVQSDPGLLNSTTTSSTTTYCGTCCDVFVEPGVDLQSSDVVREIRFDLTLPSIDCHSFSCAPSEEFDGPVRFRRQTGSDRVEVCLSSTQGVRGPLNLLRCSATTGGTDEFLIENVAALDDDLERVSPAPVLVNNPGE